jgi:hypothetical protein
MALKQYAPDAASACEANMMFIIVTDERGDDFGGDSYAILEDTVRKLSREGVRVYCIGNCVALRSPEGLRAREMDRTGRHRASRTIMPDADQGPETPLAEGLAAAVLDRQCPAAGTHVFRLRSVHTVAALCRDRLGHLLLSPMTVDRSANGTRRSCDSTPPTTDQVWSTASSCNSDLAKQCSDRQRPSWPSTNRSPYRSELFRPTTTTSSANRIHRSPEAAGGAGLLPGSACIEASGDRRKAPRQAGYRSLAPQYDLAMGRILAMRVRAYGYNSLLAEMKSSPKRFEKDGSNQWMLQPSEKIEGGANVPKMHDKSTFVSQPHHRGTSRHPWAFLAKIELSEPLGLGMA